MKFILGTKLNMTQFFDDTGRAYPATLLSISPITVTQVRTAEKDGYVAVQVGSGSKKRANKPETGHLKGVGPFRHLKEFRLNNPDDAKNFNTGDVMDVSLFSAGDIVEVSGISKGKGFQGVVKRHGFGGGPRTHGQKHSEREAGSIGGGGRAGGRVAKGMRMAGRMGGDRVTVKYLKVLAIDKEHGELLVSGAVPGRRGTLIEVRSMK